MALVACPTASIGTVARTDASAGRRAPFPRPSTRTSPSAASPPRAPSAPGATSIERPEGNVLVDSPRAAGPAARGPRGAGRRPHALSHASRRRRRPRGPARALRLRARPPRGRRHGGHARRRAPHRRPRARPPRRRPARHPDPGPHARPRGAALPREVPLHGRPPRVVAPARRASSPSATPAGTPGTEQIRSMERLLDFRFEWVLPGHGAWHHAASAGAMRRELEALRRRDATAVSRGDGQAAVLDGDEQQPPLRQTGQRLAHRRRPLGRREDDDAASAAGAAGLAAPGARAERRLDRGLDRRATRRPAPAAGAPPTRARRAVPIARKSRASAASAISRAAAADVVEARGDREVALEAGAEDLPVVHARGVRGAGVEERQVAQPCRRIDVAPVGVDAARREAEACRPPESGG